MWEGCGEHIGCRTRLPDLPASDGFRRRLLDGLAASIEERGYRESTVADIVRHARTSKRTFYDQFSGKEQCFAELLAANTEELVVSVRAAVDPEALWAEQVRQAVTAYVQHPGTPRHHAELDPGTARPRRGARPVLRRGFGLLTAMIVDLTGNPGFRRAGISPTSQAAAVILVGGLRELTAQTVEDGAAVDGIIEPAIAVSLAILGPKATA